jgi:L-lysine exporter family protein LysE/ArgO
VAQAAAFTLLNPHVYLDTVLLVGSIGAQQPAALRGWFVAGASTASLFWFGLLGFGARWLAPWFARPRAWQVLDGLIGITMWVLAALLVRHAFSGH